MRGGAGEEDIQYTLGLGGAGRLLGGQRTATTGLPLEPLLEQHGGQGQSAKACAGLFQPFAAGQKGILNSGGMIGLVVERVIVIVVHG